MSERKPQLTPIEAKLQLGKNLKELRQAAGVSREAVQELLHCSPSKVFKIERGDVGVAELELRELLDLYGVRGEGRDALQLLGATARKRRPTTTYGAAIPDRFRRFFNLEELANEFDSYTEGIIPGLTQTEDYARAVLSTNLFLPVVDVESLVEARMSRQTRFLGGEGPALRLIFCEGATRRLVGGREVMARQLDRMVELAELPNVHLQMVPFEAGAHVASGYPFTILKRSSWPSSLYIENLMDASIIDEPDRVSKYEVVFDHLARVALPPAETVRRLATIAAEL